MSRIDKYLWSVRLFKTRSIAADQCKAGKILINNYPAKPASEVKTGDLIQVKKDTAQFSYRVLSILENRVGAALVKNYLDDQTPQEEKDKQEVYLNAKNEFRDYTFGKPTKSDRRKLRKYLGD